MNNTLKLRAWDPLRKQMLYSENDEFVFGPDGFAVIIVPAGRSVQFKEFYLTPMLYLSHFDCNGTEVCEKDIIENEFGKKLVVRKGSEVYLIEQSDRAEIPAMFVDFSKTKIIGNLFESPNLI